MNAYKCLDVFSLAVICSLGCENKTTTTGSATTPAGTSRKAGEVKKLTLKAAAQQTIKQGDTDDLTIKIDRSNFDDPVTIRLKDLPQGVTCNMSEVVVPSGATEIKVTLKAASDAAVGEYKVKLDAQAPGLDENVQTLKLTVKDKG